MRRIDLIIFTAFFIVLSAGCARFALRMSPPLLTNMTKSLFEECDPLLAKEAIPASLKMMEGLLKTDPWNGEILRALSMGFAGYGLLFLEEDEPARASVFYMRSRGYALKALEGKGKIPQDVANRNTISESILLHMGHEDMEPLFWMTFSWNAWINLNLDKPEAMSQIGTSLACLEKVLALDGSYFHGLPLILQGAVLSSRPALLGGEQDKARSFFQKALELENGRFFPAPYYYAKYFAVGSQDRALFRTLLSGILSSEPSGLKEMCLINTVFRQKAAKLLEQEEELFY